MTEQDGKPITHSVAKRQLHALVRKYNQATRTNLGFKLDIKTDNQDETHVITYTLIMKNHVEDAWEVRRISSSLLVSLQPDFTKMVNYMDEQLASAICVRQAEKLIL